MKLEKLIQPLQKYNLRNYTNIEITNITADSRQVMPGSLFVAYKGIYVDGHTFIPQALKGGAVAIMTEEDSNITLEIPKNITLIKTPNGREALGNLMSAWYDYPSKKLTLISVTGTDGKTSTTNLIYTILKKAGHKVGMITSVNVVIGDDVSSTGLHTTTPDAPDMQRYLAQMVEAQTEFCILETTSHGLAQHRVAGCDFDIGVMTNITHEHLDTHGSLQEYRRAKARLFDMTKKLAILNGDDRSYGFLQKRIDGRIPFIAYGIQNNQPSPCTPQSLLQADNIILRPDMTCFDIIIDNQTYTVESELIGKFNVSNMLAALATTVLGLDIKPQLALRALRQFKGISGRMERIDMGQPFTAIVDFAHTPNSLRQVLETFHAITNKRIIAILGSAGLRDVDKRTAMACISVEFADITIITAEDPRTENLDEILDVMANAIIEKGVEMGDPSPSNMGDPTPCPSPSKERGWGGVKSHVFYRVPDRGRAILLGTQLAQPGDIVITFGKGHEQSMCFDTTEYAWDDRQAMRSALQGKPLLTLPTAEFGIRSYEKYNHV